ncbi:MAG: hypothetical protein AAFR31_09175 [Cyanobacteria bacterium J06627_8]
MSSFSRMNRISVTHQNHSSVGFWLNPNRHQNVSQSKIQRQADLNMTATNLHTQRVLNGHERGVNRPIALG